MDKSVADLPLTEEQQESLLSLILSNDEDNIAIAHDIIQSFSIEKPNLTLVTILLSALENVPIFEEFTKDTGYGGTPEMITEQELIDGVQEQVLKDYDRRQGRLRTSEVNYRYIAYRTKLLGPFKLFHKSVYGFSGKLHTSVILLTNYKEKYSVIGRKINIPYEDKKYFMTKDKNIMAAAIHFINRKLKATGRKYD